MENLVVRMAHAYPVVSALIPYRFVLRWKQKHVPLRLMISLGMIMDNVLSQGSLQRCFTDQNKLRQALFLH
jgi:hypothetical protein